MIITNLSSNDREGVRFQKKEAFIKYAQDNCWYNEDLNHSNCKSLSQHYERNIISNDDSMTTKCESSCNDYSLPSLSSIESFISGQLESMTKPPSLQPLIQPPRGTTDDESKIDPCNTESWDFPSRVKLLGALDVIVSICQPWGSQPHSTDYLYHFNQISTTSDARLLDSYHNIFSPVIDLKNMPEEESKDFYERMDEGDFFKIIYQLHCLKNYVPFNQSEFIKIFRDTLNKLDNSSLDTMETTLEDIDGECFDSDGTYDDFIISSVVAIETDYFSNDKSGEEIVDVEQYKLECQNEPRAVKQYRQPYKRCYLGEVETLKNRTRNTCRVDYRDMINCSSGNYVAKRKHQKSEHEVIERTSEKRVIKSKPVIYEETSVVIKKKSNTATANNSNTNVNKPARSSGPKYDNWWLGSSSKNLHVVSASVSYDKKQQRYMAQWKTREGAKHSKSFYAKRYKSPIQAKHHAELYKQYILNLRNRCKATGIPNTIPEPTFEQLLSGEFGEAIPGVDPPADSNLDNTESTQDTKVSGIDQAENLDLKLDLDKNNTEDDLATVSTDADTEAGGTPALLLCGLRSTPSSENLNPEEL